MADVLEYLTHAQIVPAEHNVRSATGDLAELAQSIDGIGLVQALKVRRLDNGKFELIAGWRRYSAIGLLIQAKRVKKTATWPCVVTDEPDTAMTVAAMIVENLQRSDVPPYDEMRGYIALANEHGWKVAEISTRTGVPESTIKQRMSWAKLPEHAQRRLGDGLTLDTATAWAKLPQAHIDRLGADGKIPGKWELSLAADEVTAERATTKVRALADRLGLVTCTPADLEQAVKALDDGLNGAAVDPALFAAVAMDDEKVAASGGTLEIGQQYLPNPGHDWKGFEARLMGFPAGSIITIDVKRYANVFVEVRWHGPVAATPDDVDEPDTDWDRAYAEASARYAAAEKAWEEAELEALRELAGRDHEVLLHEVLNVHLRSGAQSSRADSLVQKVAGIDLDSPDLTLADKARAWWVIKLALNRYDTPEWLLEWLPKRPARADYGFPDEDDYDEDGNYLGEGGGAPRRDQFDSDEEFEAAQQVWAEYQTEKAEREEFGGDA